MIVAKLKQFGKLPEKIADSDLQMHLDSAKRAIARAVPSGNLADPDYIEAVYCQAMIYCLPSQNLMASEGISDYSENGINHRWLNPAEVDSKIAYYEKRKAELLAVLTPAGNPENFYYGDL